MYTLSASTSLSEFKENLYIRYPFLKSYRHQHDGINSFGLRHNEPLDDVDICYFGCSYTFGEQVAANDVWTNIVDQTLNLSSNNFAVPGIGPDEMLLIFSTVLNFVKMKRAVFVLSSCSRQTIPIENNTSVGYINAFPEFEKLYNSNHVNYQTLKTWFSLPNSYYIDRTMNSINIIKQLAKYNNINLYWSSWIGSLHSMLPDKKTSHKFINDQMAKDRAHPGPQAHANFAQEIIKIL